MKTNNIGQLMRFSAEKKSVLVGRFKARSLWVGGLLHDTIYRDKFTAHTFPARAPEHRPPISFNSSPTARLNGFAKIGPFPWTRMVEYTTTLEPWGAAIPQDTERHSLRRNASNDSARFNDVHRQFQFR